MGRSFRELVTNAGEGSFTLDQSTAIQDRRDNSTFSCVVPLLAVRAVDLAVLEWIVQSITGTTGLSLPVMIEIQ